MITPTELRKRIIEEFDKRGLIRWGEDKDTVDEPSYTMGGLEAANIAEEVLSEELLDEYIQRGLDEESEKITIKYFNNDLEEIGFVGGKSDWIDLRVAEDVTMKKGEFKLIPLGVAMKLPAGYEAHIIPRSSTFKNFGIIQTNSTGLIDESYCGDNDQWMFPALAVRDTEIKMNDRICQFRIEKHQPHIEFERVEKLQEADRGGFGSTGLK